MAGWLPVYPFWGTTGSAVVATRYATACSFQLSRLVRSQAAGPRSYSADRGFPGGPCIPGSHDKLSSTIEVARAARQHSLLRVTLITVYSTLDTLPINRQPRLPARPTLQGETEYLSVEEIRCQKDRRGRGKIKYKHVLIDESSSRAFHNLDFKGPPSGGQGTNLADLSD